MKVPFSYKKTIYSELGIDIGDLSCTVQYHSTKPPQSATVADIGMMKTTKKSTLSRILKRGKLKTTHGGKLISLRKKQTTFLEQGEFKLNNELQSEERPLLKK